MYGADVTSKERAKAKAGILEFGKRAEIRRLRETNEPIENFENFVQVGEASFKMKHKQDSSKDMTCELSWTESKRADWRNLSPFLKYEMDSFKSINFKQDPVWALNRALVRAKDDAKSLKPLEDIPDNFDQESAITK